MRLTPEAPYWREIEGSEADALPAAHWVSVYRELERTAVGMQLEGVNVGSRLFQIRRRLQEWERRLDQGSV